MPRNPTVSVITPAYKAHGHLPQAVHSMLRQTYADWEMLIVSDDGADYEALLAMEDIRDPRLRFYSTDGNGTGPNNARNVALRHARGQYLLPLDADDVMYPPRLAALLPHAEKCGMCGNNVRVLRDPRNDILGQLFSEGSGIRWFDVDAYTSTSIPMTFMFRSDIVSWQWDVDVELGADTLFNLCGFETLCRVPVLETALHEYRVVPTSICHNADASLRADRAYRYCLNRLKRDRLGFKDPAIVEKVEHMLLRKLALNKEFKLAFDNGICRDFQEFMGLFQHDPQHKQRQRCTG